MIKRPALRAALLVALLSTPNGQTASADCGPAPITQAYSADFYRAEARLYEYTTGRAASGGITFEGFGVNGGESSSSHMSDYQSLTIGEARQYVQQEHQNAAAQIVDECAYRMCALLSSSTLPTATLLLGAQFQKEICLGYESPATGNPGRIVTVSPTSIFLPFQLASQPQDRTIYVNNNSQDQKTMTVDVAVDNGSSTTADGLVSLLRSGKPARRNVLRLRIKPGQSVPFQVRFNKPTSGHFETPTITIRQSSNPNPAAAAIVQVLLPPPALPAPPALQGFPATGQSFSYHANDDGDLRVGATPKYTDNGDGTLTDQNTGLMWEKKDASGGLHDYRTRYDWSAAAGGIFQWIQLVNSENGAGFAGYSDWRIPNVRELQSITNFWRNPAVNPEFDSACANGCSVVGCSCTFVDGYWSSTTYYRYFVEAPATQTAWTVDGGWGSTQVQFVTAEFFARAVRAGLASVP